ncbi:MAG: GNAT family N-acetyltransferase [Sphingobacterium sp.]|jgi:GNAT superfamily N-acetyltransferase|nr:GNAT family N-acetyltransferase [Sphingobacterium sp.]
MTKENIAINEKNYTLYIAYQDNERLRLEFNRMTQHFWGFDFENFYQSGFWDDNCVLYSLFDEDRIVAHTTVSLFQQAQKTLIQLGTVMTDENYQRRGLSRCLLHRVNRDFSRKNDGMFLFANESVLDFYPKFGFSPVAEYVAFQIFKQTNMTSILTKRKLNLDNSVDLELFENLVEQAVSNTQFQTRNKGLALFYCYAYPEMGFKDAIYYIEELDCAVVVQEESKVLYIVELFATQEVDLKAVVSAFSEFSFTEVVFGFTPKCTEGVEWRIWKEDDLQLFVTQEVLSFFEDEHIKVATLSHT